MGRRIRGLATILLAGLILAGLWSCSTPGSGTDSIAGNAPDSSRTDTASLDFKIKKLTREMAYSPESYKLWYDRSLLYYEAGNTAQAIEDVEKAISLFPNGPEPVHLRGFYAYVQNQSDVALSYFEKAADLGSDNPETFYQMGQIYFFRKDFGEAEKFYTIAEQLDSLDPQYPFARGFLHQQKGEHNRAVKFYEAALEKDPEFVKALAQLHDIYQEVYKDGQAAQAFNERILKADSLHPVGRFNQGNLFLNMAMGITDQAQQLKHDMLLRLAITEYSNAVLGDPNFTQAFYNRGYCFYLIDKYDEAMDDFDRVLAQDPYNEKAFFMRGSIHEYFGDFANAKANYAEAVKINPNFEDAVQAELEMEGKLNFK